jgi:hypothetical protein
MAGYTRQSSASIQPNEDVTAAPLNDEFNQIQSAFNASTGHAHDGTTGNGPQLNLTAAVTGVLPQANGGTGSSDGNISFGVITATTDVVTSDINSGSASGLVNIGGGAADTDGANIIFYGGTHATFPDVAVFRIDTTAHTTIDANGDWDFDNDINVDGTATLATVDIAAGAIDGTVIGGSSAAAGTFTDLTASGNINLSGSTISDGGTITTIDINGGTIDGTVIGGSAAVAGTFTTLTATGAVNFDSGTIDNIVIGGSTPAALTATTITATGNVSFEGSTTIGNATGDSFIINPSTWTLNNAVTISGTWADLGTVTTVDINGGTIDGTVIGGSSAAAGTFTDLTADNVTASSNITASSYSGGPLSSFRNKTINGGFEVNQRGTSYTTSGEYTLDRWLMTEGSGAACTISQGTHTLGQTDVPGNPKNYLVWERGTAGSAASTVEQRIESVATLSGGTATVTFYVEADAATEINVDLVQNFGTSGSPSSDVTTSVLSGQSVTTGFTKVTTTVSVPSISGKTLGSDENDYVSLVFERDHDDTNSTTTVRISRVSIVEGDATAEDDPFSPRGVLEETLCYRYYQIVGNGSSGGWINATSAQLGVSLPAVLRSNPSSVELTTGTVGIANIGVALRTSNGSSTISVIGVFSNKGGLVTINDFISAATVKDNAALYSDVIAVSAEL